MFAARANLARATARQATRTVSCAVSREP